MRILFVAVGVGLSLASAQESLGASLAVVVDGRYVETPVVVPDPGDPHFFANTGTFVGSAFQNSTLAASGFSGVGQVLTETTGSPLLLRSALDVSFTVSARTAFALTGSIVGSSTPVQGFFGAGADPPTELRGSFALSGQLQPDVVYRLFLSVQNTPRVFAYEYWNLTLALPEPSLALLLLAAITGAIVGKASTGRI